jgi:hypothetical protein
MAPVRSLQVRSNKLEKGPEKSDFTLSADRLIFLDTPPLFRPISL